MFFREKRQLIIFATAVFFAVVFLLFGYIPLRQKHKSVDLEFAEAQSFIERASIQNEQLSALKEQLAGLDDKLSDYELNIPSERGLGDFLNKIADLMKEHNLTAQQVQPLDEIEAEQVNCIPVNMKCKGRMKDIFEFYKSLEELERMVRIEQVKILNDSDFNGQVNMETKAAIYYRPGAIEG